MRNIKCSVSTAYVIMKSLMHQNEGINVHKLCTIMIHVMIDLIVNPWRSNVNYHSTMIPYLDYIEESTEDFICTRDDGAIRTTL
ncbi:hypothetical protein RDI58_022613 [Solanum bulbocastanum]|uniref:Uncharacterized protein n=1 Tax=Solanum bulbocastanum TaxID=147425 RepID=A0AAN8Y5T7_SOLBU